MKKNKTENKIDNVIPHPPQQNKVKKTNEVVEKKEKKTTGKKISEMNFPELKAFKDLLGEMAVSNRYAQGNTEILINSGILTEKINNEINKRVSELLKND